MHRSRFFLAVRCLLVALTALAASCASSQSGADGGEGATEAELQALYQAKLREIQSLNAEMAKANETMDFATVNAKGKEALQRATEAKAIASRFADPREKSVALAEIGKISGNLEQLVKITGG